MVRKIIFKALLYLLVLFCIHTSGQQKEDQELLNLNFIEVQPGTFIMGSNMGRDNEKPARRVAISHKFEMSECEVTQKVWFDIMCSSPANQLSKLRKEVGRPNYMDLRGVGIDYPMYLVSWYEIQEFLSRLNAQSRHYKYRLPTEAEWEYAARAGTQTQYSFGNSEQALHEYGWFIENSNATTHTVATKKPNPWGFYDMHGNVYEWVRDTVEGSERVMKGGSWGNPAESCQSARRTIVSPGSRSRGLGFRLVRERK